MTQRFASPLGLAALMITLLPSVIQADEATIRQTVVDYVTAFNSEDLEALRGMWTEDAAYTDKALAERVSGRDTILEDIAAVFSSTDSAKLSGSVEYVRMIREDIAQVDGTVTLTIEDQLPSVNEFSAILVDEEGSWKIDSMEETPLALPPNASTALNELAWLLGAWVDNESETQVRSAVRMAVGGSFMVRTFQAEGEEGALMQGTQVIGWDPRSLQIRSWSFNADGSFGDGTWSQNGDQWLVKSTQTLSDGQAASGTYIITPVDADSFSVQLVGHEIEGEPQPSRPEVTVTRVSESESGGTNPDAIGQQQSPAEVGASTEVGQ